MIVGGEDVDDCAHEDGGVAVDDDLAERDDPLRTVSNTLEL